MYHTLAPSGGLGYFVIFLFMQPEAHAHLLSYMPCLSVVTRCCGYGADDDSNNDGGGKERMNRETGTSIHDGLSGSGAGVGLGGVTTSSNNNGTTTHITDGGGHGELERNASETTVSDDWSIHSNPPLADHRGGEGSDLHGGDIENDQFNGKDTLRDPLLRGHPDGSHIAGSTALGYNQSRSHHSASTGNESVSQFPSLQHRHEHDNSFTDIMSSGLGTSPSSAAGRSWYSGRDTGHSGFSDLLSAQNLGKMDDEQLGRVIDSLSRSKSNDAHHSFREKGKENK